MKDFWFRLDDKIRFLFIGGFNFLVSYLLYSLFCITLGVHYYQISLALAWAVSSIISYTTQKFLVFQSKGPWLKEYIKCCSTWFISYITNAVLLELFVKTAHLNVFISQFLATFAASVVTYILFKTFAFRATK